MRATAGRPRPDPYVRVSALLFLLLAAASWTFLFTAEQAQLAALFSAESWTRAQAFLARLAGAGTERPAFADPARWREALRLTYETLTMSVLAIGLAAVGMLLTVIPAARTAADGSLTLSRTPWARVLYGLVRSLYTICRALPELLLAMLVVLVLSPGILPGAVALGLHNFGILGKLCAEVVEDLDLRPVRAVRAAGASTLQSLAYAVLPTVLPQFLTYILYRWEVIIRTTIVVGFVSAGGLGREFRLAMSWFRYTDVTLLLICYVLLVFGADALSALLRRLAR